MHFYAPIGNYSDRFYIKFSNNSLGNPDEDFVQPSIFIDQNLEELIVKNNQNSLEIHKVYVYNLLGQQIYQWTIEDATLSEYRFSLRGASSHVYFVNMETNKGKVAQKIIKQ